MLGYDKRVLGRFDFEDILPIGPNKTNVYFSSFSSRTIDMFLEKESFSQIKAARAYLQFEREGEFFIGIKLDEEESLNRCTFLRGTIEEFEKKRKVELVSRLLNGCDVRNIVISPIVWRG